jgi:DNA adenine methylase
MKYLGGKSRYGSRIADVVLSHRLPVYEPFCGGLWVTQYLKPVIASDAHEPLICLYKAVQQGWEPPDYVSESEYKELQDRDKEGEIDPLITFAGFAVSWGGIWFGGYARGGARNYAVESKKSLLTKMENLKGITFEHRHYRNCKFPKNSIVYCDPPYKGTREYCLQFSTDEFWDWVRGLVRQEIIVYVSEFNAPDEFVSVAEFPTSMMHSIEGQQTKIDNLFVHSDQQSFGAALFAV